MPNPIKIRVRWSEHKGYVAMQNPVDGRVYFVLAKGLPRWLFDRMEKDSDEGIPFRSGVKSANESPPATGSSGFAVIDEPAARDGQLAEGFNPPFGERVELLFEVNDYCPECGSDALRRSGGWACSGCSATW